MENYSFYVGDVETTALDLYKSDVIELSLIRLSDGEQKTWHMKPLNPEYISEDSLRINGHKLEDITWRTKEGREKYLEQSKVLIEIENWVLDDGVPSEKRFLVGQNVGFDLNMVKYLWEKNNSETSFPFGRRIIDTMVIELMLDYCKGSFAEGYSLSNLTKKYGVKNEKAHSAAADTLATKLVFEKQVELFKKLLSNV